MLLPGSSVLHLEEFASQKLEIVLKGFATGSRVDGNVLNKKSESERSSERRISNITGDATADDDERQEATNKHRERRFLFRRFGLTRLETLVVRQPRASRGQRSFDRYRGLTLRSLKSYFDKFLMNILNRNDDMIMKKSIHSKSSINKS